MRVAVILHVGSLQLLPELLNSCHQLHLANVIYDLYVNLVESKVDVAKARELIITQVPTATIVISENRGMDIGGLFQLLPLVLKGEYDFLLKLHTKNLDWWRHILIDPLCGNPHRVNLCLQLFQNNPLVGMIGSKKCLLTERYGQAPNHYYLQQLANRFKLPLKSCHFIGGTMFWVRTSVFKQALQMEDMSLLISEMNTPTTLDPHWYCLTYRNEVGNMAHSWNHWEKYGKFKGYFRNCLEARERNCRKYLPDGMIEHAYERFFGFAIESLGFIVLGV